MEGEIRHKNKRCSEEKRAPRSKATEQQREREREREREIRCIESENKRESWIKSEFSSERERDPAKKGGRQIQCRATERAST